MLTCHVLLIHAAGAQGAVDTSTLHRGNGGEPDSLHIHQAQGLNSQNILRDICEGLMTMDANGRPAAGVAESWHVSDDGLHWTFQLRKNARWHDGSPVLAEDFVRAWRMAVTPQSQAHQAQLFDVLKNAHAIRTGTAPAEKLGVKALSGHQLLIQLTHAEPMLPEYLSLPVFCPLPARPVATDGSYPASNGAYFVQQWVPQEKVVLQKNPHFHAARQVFFEHVVYHITEEPASELKRFRAGELDLTETIPDNQIDWIRQHMPQRLHIYPYLGTFFLGLNIRHPPLDRPALREALFWAIDRDILTQKVLKSGQQPAYRIIPPAMMDENATNTLPPFVSRNAQLAYARKKLAESGVRPHTAAPVEILYNTSANQRKVALAVAAMWRQNLGIRARLRNVEWKVFVNERKKPHRQVFRSGWIADINDPLDFLRLFSHDSPNNFYHYHNPDYDELLQRIEKSPQSQRQHQIRQAEEILLRDIPVIPLYFYVSRHLLSARIGGYRDNVADRHLSRYLYDKHTSQPPL